MFLLLFHSGLVLLFAGRSHILPICSAKGPLAILTKALEVLDDRFANGGDINCGFSATALHSSLGPLIHEKKIAFPVNAFHGYSHNMQCQDKNHPSVFEGVGLEDFEQCERTFSRSNPLATLVRFTSRYRRRLLIDTHYRNWDADKYANLGTFILNNYMQALEILKCEVPTLEESMRQFNITDDIMDEWQQERTEFLSMMLLI